MHALHMSPHFPFVHRKSIFATCHGHILCVCVCLWDTVVMVLLYLFFANPALFCAIIDDLGRGLDVLRKLCPELLHHQSRST